MLVIAGPTGAGKSGLALRVAEHFQGEIVNCDSLQVYRGFDVGTAKLPESERRGIPHHMLDVVEPSEVYSAGDYARGARQVISRITGAGHLPIVTGGTGFYLRALLNGLPSLPARDEGLRARLAPRETRRPGSLHRLLSRLDPPAGARIHVRDVQKLTRALEIRLLTRNPQPPSSSAQSLTGYRILKLGLQPERASLYEALDARATEMFREGLLEEVQGLLAAGCTGNEKPFESLGYQQALQYIRGMLTIEQAIASTQLETRQYAKRQLTWFRRDPEIVWLQGFGNSSAVIEQCLDLVRNFLK
jgi:tRNA dimethylallyltransferase